MTALAHSVSETPMAPYIGIMQGMNINDLNVVIEFLKETVRKAEEAKRKAEDEFLAKKWQKSKSHQKLMNYLIHFALLLKKPRTNIQDGF